jgi:hypothetical protein
MRRCFCFPSAQGEQRCVGTGANTPGSLQRTDGAWPKERRDKDKDDAARHGASVSSRAASAGGRPLPA